jgi:hypothetical protein
MINTDYANVIGFRRYKEKGKGFYFSPKLIEWLGPKREGDIADDPYIHYAASMQKLFEDLSLQMIDYYLGDILQGNRQAGLRRRRCAERQAEPEDHRPPGREGTVRAAGVRRCRHGRRRRRLRLRAARRVPVEKMEHVYLGPSYSNEDVIAACARHPEQAAVAQDRQTCLSASPRSGRRQSGGLVPGTHGVRPARPRRSLDPWLPERYRRRRPHQRTDQVPRALAPLLPEHARHRRPRKCSAAITRRRS